MDTTSLQKDGRADIPQEKTDNSNPIYKELERRQSSQAPNTLPTTPGPGDDGSVRKAVRQALQKMTPGDDVEAFLAVFERVAEREKLPTPQWAEWPKERWADLLAPFLAGEAQKAYFDLEPEAAHDFDKLKAEILARLGVTTAVRAQRVHQWTYQPDKPPRSQMFDLIHLTKKWLQLEVLTAPEMVQRIVLDKYLRALPPSLKKWVSHGNPTTADQLVDLVERYSLAEGLMDDATNPRSSPSRRGSVF
ncbi:uncharacterized protein ACNLHF_005028 [Anomaloglossus baeobatrachus]